MHPRDRHTLHPLEAGRLAGVLARNDLSAVAVVLVVAFDSPVATNLVEPPPAGRRIVTPEHLVVVTVGQRVALCL